MFEMKIEDITYVDWIEVKILFSRFNTDVVLFALATYGLITRS